MYYRIVHIVFLILLSKSLVAQDVVNFTQFFFNPYTVNPSYAGIDGRPSIAVAYRKQWATIDGGPTIINFSLHVPASKRLGIGLNVVQDSRGILSNTGLMFSASYNMSIAEQSFIRVGFSGGASWNKVDMDKLEGFSDNAISKILAGNAYLLGNAGVSFHLKSFHAGVSLPVLFSPAYVATDVFSMTEVKPFEAFVVHLSNRFYFAKDKYVFEPYLLYRVNTGLPSQYEAAAVLHMNHVLYIGGSYKQDFGISGLGGIKLKNTFAIGASYTVKNTGINELNSPTYEVHLGYLFGAHKKEAPVYSFIDTHKVKEKKPIRKSASELIAEKRLQDETTRKKNEALAKKAPSQQKMPAVKTQPTPTQETKNLQPQSLTAKGQNTNLTTPAATENVTSGTHRPRFDHADATDNLNVFEVTAHTPEDEKERISRLTLHAENPSELHTDPIHPNSERHEFVSRGTHKEELKTSNYVISGIFREESNAAKFSNGLKKMGFNAGYGHLTEKSAWYVYVFKTDDINGARQERDRLRKTKLLRDAWLLTVLQ